jgi:two-component system response regulator HydG
MCAPTVLLVSEDRSFVETVEKSKPGADLLNLEVSSRLEESWQHLQRQDIALFLIHVSRTQEEDLLPWITAASQVKRRPATVLLSDAYRHDQAIACLRAGAGDYLGLPLAPGRLSYLLDVLTLRARHGRPGAGGAAGDVPDLYDPTQFLLTPEMAKLMKQVRRVAPTDTTLLLSGETGTGKTRLARLIHELSARRDEPFQVVDCGSLAPSLIESEMFGHVKGAFSGSDRDRAGKFAAAAEGTLLLDEINSLPPALQSKLLRAVDERLFEPVGSNKSFPLRARIIAASNALLEQEVTQGRFRADLYFRLNVVEFHMTPLRERRQGISLLANRFLADIARRNHRPIDRIAEDARACLEDYHWPGNIRELRNVLERAVALCPGNEITIRDLPEALRPSWRWDKPVALASATVADSLHGKRTLLETREEIEILQIMQALQRHKNNRLRAAAELGISRVTLYKKLHRYGLLAASSAGA